MNELDKFLEICGECGLRKHAKKSYFFVIEAQFCGRVLSEGKVRYDPRQLEALVNMKRPRKAN